MCDGDKIATQAKASRSELGSRNTTGCGFEPRHAGTSPSPRSRQWRPTRVINPLVTRVDSTSRGPTARFSRGLGDFPQPLLTHSNDAQLARAFAPAAPSRAARTRSARTRTGRGSAERSAPTSAFVKNDLQCCCSALQCAAVHGKSPVTSLWQWAWAQRGRLLAGPRLLLFAFYADEEWLGVVVVVVPLLQPGLQLASLGRARGGGPGPCRGS